MPKKVSLTLFVVYTLFVAYVSLKPGGGQGWLVEPYDKVAHLAVYALFAVFAHLLRLKQRQFLALCVGIVIYSALLEFGQSLVPGRTMSILDLVANTAGVLAGSLFCRRIAAYGLA